MNVRSSIGVALIVAFSSGCTPPHTELVFTSAGPPKPPDCPIEFVQSDVANGTGIAGRHERIGEVAMPVLASHALNPDVVEFVRSRACAMGGDSVAIIGQKTEIDLVGFGKIETKYAILRKRATPTSVGGHPSRASGHTLDR
jgi:hypothetical protein